MLIRAKDLIAVQLVTVIPSSRYIAMPLFNATLPYAGMYQVVTGGSWIMNVQMNDIDFHSVSPGYNIQDDDSEYQVCRFYDARSYRLDLGSIKPTTGSSCFIVFFANKIDWLQYCLNKIPISPPSTVTLNSTQSALLSGTAKKSDLQFTDSANKTWELMDLITANLPFRYSD